jgi:ribosome biogenesis GTPase
MQLEEFGWDEYFETEVRAYDERGSVPGRVCRCHREEFLVRTAGGETVAEVTGRLRYTAEGPDDWPVVGDWVVLLPGFPLIDGVLPRRSALTRASAGKTSERQVLCANINVALVVTAPDHDFNPRRLERYILMVREGGAEPVIVLNKADLVEGLSPRIAEASRVAADVPVLAVSARTGDGMDRVAESMPPGKTGVLVGSSGVGKSSIINRLLGYERFAAGQIRESDGRGRHTTTHRELVRIPGAGLLIDTPGLRELAVWGSGDAARSAFGDIAALAERCRFRDCTHQSEPGCAVLAAVENAELDADRYEGFLKLRRELEFLNTRTDERAALESKRKVKQLHKMIRRLPNKRT